jgi:hypothetical protein
MTSRKGEEVQISSLGEVYKGPHEQRYWSSKRVSKLSTFLKKQISFLVCFSLIMDVHCKFNGIR